MIFGDSHDLARAWVNLKQNLAGFPRAFSSQASAGGLRSPTTNSPAKTPFIGRPPDGQHPTAPISAASPFARRGQSRSTTRTKTSPSSARVAGSLSAADSCRKAVGAASASAVGALVLVAGLAWLGYAVRNFAAHDPRFRIDSSDNIQILGNSEVTQAELLSVFGGDMGRNVFFVPLGARRAELEHLPWVETATVMRLLPNQLRLSVTERTPIAFVRNGSNIGLVDRDGVLLDMAPETMAAKHYSFPVITGITVNDPPSTRAARMKIYQRFIAEIDSTGEKLSSQLSEVDISDPEDVKALVPPTVLMTATNSCSISAIRTSSPAGTTTNSTSPNGRLSIRVSPRSTCATSARLCSRCAKTRQPSPLRTSLPNHAEAPASPATPKTLATSQAGRPKFHTPPHPSHPQPGVN